MGVESRDFVKCDGCFEAESPMVPASMGLMPPSKPKDWTEWVCQGKPYDFCPRCTTLIRCVMWVPKARDAAMAHVPEKWLESKELGHG